MPSVPLNGTDEWLLKSIREASRRKGAALVDILSVGDYLNRSIFSLPELRSGLAKLLAAGCIREKKGLWWAAAKSTSATFDPKRFTDPRQGEPDWTYPLDERAYLDAVAAYRKGFEQAPRKRARKG